MKLQHHKILSLLIIILLTIFCQPSFAELKNPALEALKTINKKLFSPELKGEKYFQHYCVICHGNKGKGDGFNAFNLNPKPKDLAKIVPKVSDGYLFKIISEGSAANKKSPLCPPHGKTLGEDKIHAIISYLKTLPKTS